MITLGLGRFPGPLSNFNIYNMNHFKGYKLILYCFLFLIAAGCNDKWDEYTEVNPSLKVDLTQRIKAEPQLSIFSDLLSKSRYGAILASSLNFTVWAPTNEALATLDPAIVADSARLDAFVGNHITYSAYLTSVPNPFLKLRALNGKNVIFTNNSIDEITITQANQYVSNGVLHIIGGMIQPKQNIYEFLRTQTAATIQRDFIESFNEKQFNPDNAVLLGYDADGKPIYKPGTDTIISNSYLNFSKINREDSLFTYVILNNDAFLAEEVKLKPYFVTSTADSTILETRKSIITDLIFSGLYLPGNLPDSLTSTAGVNFHLDPGAIVSSHRVSNGIVYIMNRIDYKVPNKLRPVVIEGESSRVLSAATISNFTATRRNPDGLTTYTQIRGDNFSAAKSWFRYTRKFHSTKYKVYWRAIRDFNLTPVTPTGTPTYFRQRIAFKKFDALDALPYKFVEAREVISNPASTPRVFEPIYDEVYVGEYEFSRFVNEHVFVVSNDVNTVGLNSIVFDYIKLVPLVK